MKLADFLANAQSKMIENQNRIQSKIDELSVQIQTNQTKPTTQKNTKQESKPKPKPKPKPKCQPRNQSNHVLSVETISIQILKQRDQIIKNGFKEYKYISNRNCCPLCDSLNGKHFPIKDFKIGVNAPPMHDGCCCSISAYEDHSEYDEWLDFIAAGGTSKQRKKNKKIINTPRG